MSQKSARTRCLASTNLLLTTFLLYQCLVHSTGVTLHFYCFRFEHPEFVKPILELFRSDTLNFSLSFIFTIYLESLGLYACENVMFSALSFLVDGELFIYLLDHALATLLIGLNRFFKFSGVRVVLSLKQHGKPLAAPVSRT